MRTRPVVSCSRLRNRPDERSSARIGVSASPPGEALKPALGTGSDSATFRSRKSRWGPNQYTPDPMSTTPRSAIAAAPPGCALTVLHMSRILPSPDHVRVAEVPERFIPIDGDPSSTRIGRGRRFHYSVEPEPDRRAGYRKKTHVVGADETRPSDRRLR